MTHSTILIVDDEENVRLGLRHALRGRDYRLLDAAGGEAALELLKSDPADLVVSDHLMPGMTGLEFLRLVRDRHPDTARIMLTGHADMSTAVRGINEGLIHRFLAKPCDQTELLVTVHLALEQLELERENRRLLALLRTSPELARQLEAQHRRSKRAPPAV